METELEELAPKIMLGDSRFLFLDISSSCTGYSIFEVNYPNRSATLKKAGCIWFNPRWDHAEIYDYMYGAIQSYFEVVEAIDHIVVEQYAINPKKMSGVMVVIELQGSIKASAQSNGVKVSSVPVQTWRSQLGIKPNITVGEDGKKKKDYKTPCKDYIKTLVNVPEQINSNITGKPRTTPSDVYDSLGVAFGWLKKMKFANIKSDECSFNNQVGEL